MKNYGLIFFLILFALPALSLPFPASTQGRFFYNHQFEVLSAKKTLIVRALSESGRKELARLRQEGFTCNHKAQQTYHCSKFFPGTEIPLDLTAHVEKSLPFQRIHFEKPEGNPQLITAEDTYQEWQWNQKVLVNNEKFAVTHLSIAGGVEKLILRIGEEWRYELLREKNRIGVTSFITPDHTWSVLTLAHFELENP